MTLWYKLASALNLSWSKVKRMVSVCKKRGGGNECMHVWVSCGEQTPNTGDHKSRLIKSRSSVSRIRMKGGMTQPHLLFRLTDTWSDPGQQLSYLILLYSWLFKSKCQSLTCCVYTHTHTHTHTGGVEGCSAVSDFQLIHKHKRPLCLASTTLPLLIHRSGRVPVQRPPNAPPSLLHPDSFAEILKFLQLL